MGEKKEEEQKAEPPRQDISEDMARQINEAADKLAAENARFEANQKVLEAQRVEKMLAGKADAGKPQKEETPEEYAERMLRGETDE